MSFIRSLLSRLLGKKIAPKSPEEPEQTPPPAPVPPPEPPQPKPQLQLPKEHPINGLWSTYCSQHERIPTPGICFEGVDEADVKSQLLHLQLFVNTTAKQRMELLRPKASPKDKDKEKEPAVPNLNALPVVFVSKTGLSAWVMIYPPSGAGKHVEQGDLVRALEKEHVKFGVDRAFLDTLPQRQDRYFHLFRVAQGEPAQNGADGQVNELFARTVERSFAVDEQNRMDYTSLTFFQHVEEGGTICEIVPPTKGVPGRTVRDQAIAAKDGRTASVPKGRNTQMNEDGSALVASISGEVEFSGRCFQVNPVLEIGGNVDFSTGNINFVGDVHICGDVCSGFTVKAMGNITVDGVVEACSVEAGGDLVVVRGVQGDGQAVIRSQQNLFAKYLENCCVYVKETLHTDSIINCNVYCDDSVEVRSGRMTIMGGCIRASREVSAGIIGSRTECRTDVLLGGQPCSDLDNDLLHKEIQDLTAELETTERQPNSPQKHSRLSKLRVKLIVAQKKLAELQGDGDSQEEAEKPEKPAFNYNICRMLCDTAYPGTCLTIGGEMTQLDHKLTPCAASLIEGEIHLI